MDTNNNYEKRINAMSQIKVVSIASWFFLIVGIIFFATSVINLITFPSATNNKRVVYAIKENNTYTYKLNNKIINITSIKNKSGETLVLDNMIDGASIKLYCDKSDNDKCTRLTMAQEKPLGNIILSIIVLILGSFYFVFKIQAKHIQKGDPDKVSGGMLLGVLFLLLSITMFVVEIPNYTKINRLLKQNNKVKAVIYSEAYDEDDNIGKLIYKPIASYTVDGKEYIYVSFKEIDGTLEENKDKKITLYYDEEDPSINMVEGEKTDTTVMVAGVILFIFGILLVFFSKKLQRRAYEKSKTTPEPEWKI